jgi:hypothetical protein
MKINQKLLANWSNPHGGVLVLVALLLFVFIGVAALAIDIGYISTTKNELQNVSDAAALGATGKLGQIYLANGAYDHSTDYAAIRDVVTVELTNRAAGLDINVEDSDIEVGVWDFVSHTFVSLDDPITLPNALANAVKVTARRDTKTNGPINALFAGIFDIDTFDVTTDSVAALSGQGELEPGEMKLPIGVSQRWFLDTTGPDGVPDGEPDGCREEIHLNDTGTACAGWHSYFDTVSSTTVLNEQVFGTILQFNEENTDFNYGFFMDVDNVDYNSAQLETQWLQTNYPAGITNEGLAWLLVRYKNDPAAINYFTKGKVPPPFESPGADANIDSFEFMGGVSAGMFDDPDGSLQGLFDFFKVRDEIGDEPLLDEFGVEIDEDDIWRTTVPVYLDGDSGCDNPTQTTLITGAADIIVKGINPAPANDVDIEITCSTKRLRGSGGNGGVIGAIPNLVE